ncbi:DUF3107 domain-containing protein [Leucobacter sp. UT-8R-CII-1-4]|uniref:DUF3107 domain-containing protein n=1 Tax=Leucobacter sp. UT-8R-CII-1-4 TaxID=3040075 RepID=UPI0024A8354F|nr:DUF3107 domain-containing protein [Leucobacter sp. UT-8R-CII-1-4]MDI6023118.1 DUF3107 domain-containing protein [Leucobacter sp. UT-8R-CII-1-4]
MEVRIGIKHSPRELSFEIDATADEVRALIEKAAADDSEFLSLTDSKGRQYLVDTDSVSYVELGAESGRKVGFIN